jgi:beta-lactamase regulating signal transducer with metallopeptidase domain
MILELLDSISAWMARHDGLGLLLEFVLKATLMLALGLLLATVLWKCSAAQRFQMVWLSVLAMPLFLAATLTNAMQEAWVGFSFSVPSDMPQLSLELERPAAASAVSLPASDGGNISVRPTSTAAALPTERWQPMLVLVWLLGVGFCCLRGLLARLWILVHCRRWKFSMSGPLHQALALHSAAMGFKQCPQLLVSATWVMPCTWGWFRPAILLPTAAEHWSTERLTMVLNHELSHISRRDALLHSFAVASLSLVWLNVS